MSKSSQAVGHVFFIALILLSRLVIITATGGYDTSRDCTNLDMF